MHTYKCSSNASGLNDTEGCISSPINRCFYSSTRNQWKHKSFSKKLLRNPPQNYMHFSINDYIVLNFVEFEESYVNFQNIS